MLFLMNLRKSKIRTDKLNSKWILLYKRTYFYKSFYVFISTQIYKYILALYSADFTKKH